MVRPSDLLRRPKSLHLLLRRRTMRAVLSRPRFWKSKSRSTLLKRKLWEPGLIQRFHFDNRGAVVASHPESNRRRRVIDKHAADIGRTRKQVFERLTGFRIQP